MESGEARVVDRSLEKKEKKRSREENENRREFWESDL